MARERDFNDTADTPEMIELCVNCTRDSCEGWCDEYRHKYHLLRYGVDLEVEKNEKYTYNGQTMTASEWAQEYGLVIKKVIRMLRRGVPIAEVLEDESCRVNGTMLIEFCGQKKTLSGWARATGLSKTAISQRLKKGMTIEEALTTPRSPYGRKNKNGVNIYERTQSNV